MEYKVFHLQSDRGSDDHALPQISDTNHETQTVVSDGDHGVTAEDQSLCTTVGLSGFHEDTT